MCPLSTLPDLCVLTILDRVPVHDLYHTVPLVCKRWTTLHDTACHRRKTLILVRSQNDLSSSVEGKFACGMLKYAIREDGTSFKSDEIPHHYKNSCLVCPLEYSSGKLIPYFRMTELFHNVQMLKIIQISLSAYDLCTVQVLLHELAASIVDLNIVIYIEEPENEDDERDNDRLNRTTKDGLNSIMYLISNRMNHLKHLSLDIQTSNSYTQGGIKLDLKVISTLETLSYESYGLVDQHDNNEPLREIELYGSNTTSLRDIFIENKINLDCLLNLNPELAKKFTQIQLIDGINLGNVEEFTQCCFRFNSLVVLSIRIEHSYWKVIRALTNLRQLIHLTVSIDLKSQNIDQQEQQESARIPSVVALSLYIETKSHAEFGALNLPATMPNLQVILLRHDSLRCAECGYGPVELEQLMPSDDSKIIAKQMQNCMKQARCSLYGLEKLRKLNVNMMPNTRMMNEDIYAMEMTRDELLN